MKAAYERSAETDKLIGMFKDMSLDAPMGFQEASKLAGFSVRSTSAAYHSARRIVERDHGIVIEAIRGFGFKRMTAGQIVMSGSRDLRAIRRRANRGAQKQSIAIMSNLTKPEMLRATEQHNRMSLIAHTAAPIRQKAIKSDTLATNPLSDMKAFLNGG